MRTILLTAIFLCGILVGPAATLPLPSQSTDLLHRTFAACVGRYSAEVEHSWLLPRRDQSRYESQRSAFLSLLDAVTPDALRPATLNHRIDAKMAHAALLNSALFSLDARQAEWAQRRAAEEIQLCSMLLLEG
ncbi:MAG: hypothetical protein AAF871_01310 [Pseudomonadota bacterium]